MAIFKAMKSEIAVLPCDVRADRVATSPGKKPPMIESTPAKPVGIPTEVIPSASIRMCRFSTSSPI